MTLALTVLAAIDGYFSGANDVAQLKREFKVRYKKALADGVDANEVDKVFADQRALAALASEDLDLAGGLTNAFGAAITFAEIVALVIKAAPENTNDVVVGGKGSQRLGGPVRGQRRDGQVKPGMTLLMAGPEDGGLGAVTPGTGDLLKIANSAGGTPVTYDVLIIGRSS